MILVTQSWWGPVEMIFLFSFSSKSFQNWPTWFTVLIRLFNDGDSFNWHSCSRFSLDFFIIFRFIISIFVLSFMVFPSIFSDSSLNYKCINIKVKQLHFLWYENLLSPVKNFKKVLKRLKCIDMSHPLVSWSAEFFDYLSVDSPKWLIFETKKRMRA